MDHIISIIYKNIIKFIKFRQLKPEFETITNDELERIQTQNQKDKFNVIFDKLKSIMIVVINDEIKLNSKLAEYIFKKYMTNTVKEILIISNMKYVNDSSKNTIINKMIEKEEKLSGELIFDDNISNTDDSNVIEDYDSEYEYDTGSDIDTDTDTDTDAKTTTTESTVVSTTLKSRITIRFCSNSLFISNLPKNLHMPKIEVLKKEDTDILFEKNLINKSNLPEISFNDPLIIWAGANIGDVVKLSRLSEVSGYGISYKLVSQS